MVSRDDRKLKMEKFLRCIIRFNRMQRRKKQDLHAHDTQQDFVSGKLMSFASSACKLTVQLMTMKDGEEEEEGGGVRWLSCLHFGSKVFASLLEGR